MSEYLKSDPDSILPEHVEKSIITIGNDIDVHNITLNVSLGSENGDNYLGKIIRVEVNGFKDETPQSIALIAKVAPLQEESFVNNVYKKEISAYTEILPKLYECQIPHLQEENRFHLAKYYKASDERAKEFVIMEDLCADGYKMFDRKKSLDLDHLTLVMKTLAQFHATSFVFQRKDEKQFKKFIELINYEIDYSTITDDVIEKSNEKLMSVIDDPICKEKISHFVKDIKLRSEKYLKPETTAPYNVIAHGDCWNANFMFKYRNDNVIDMKIIDWQTLRLCSPVIDVACMIFLCTDEQIRHLHYLNMLELYYNTLEDSINKMGFEISECYPKHVFESHVKSLMNFGLVMAMSVLPMILSDDPPNEYNEEDGDAAWFMVPYSDLFIDRINGIIRDFIKYNYI